VQPKSAKKATAKKSASNIAEKGKQAPFKPPRPRQHTTTPAPAMKSPAVAKQVMNPYFTHPAAQKYVYCHIVSSYY
jgi:hypothetical protein